MIVIKFLENLLHDGLTEKYSLGTYPELLTLLAYRSHLAIVKVNDLPVTTGQSLLLLPQIIRIDS